MSKSCFATQPDKRLWPHGGKYLLTVLACIGTTAVGALLAPHVDDANIVMLFLLTVLLVAVSMGRSPAILASGLGVLLFDLFFVPPRFSLAVSDLQYLITFAAMLATGLITAHLAAGLRQQAYEASERERQSAALYKLARQFAGALTLEQVVGLVHAFVKEQAGAASAILVQQPDAAGMVPLLADSDVQVEARLAEMSMANGKPVHSGQMDDLGYASLYLPLSAPMHRRGVLVVALHGEVDKTAEGIVPLLEAVASLTAIALERVHYVEVAQHTEVGMQTERLRSSILSALSHDLRTPLTAMVGLADSLQLVKPPLPMAVLEIAHHLREQATHLSGMVANLLDMARLQAGEIRLRKEWQPLEEVIGSSIHLLDAALARHPVQVHLPPDLPLLEFDAVLLERVFCNLLENAAKYAPVNTPITISAQRQEQHVTIEVADRGPGFPPLPQADLFGMFVRGETETGKPGTGLGLAICRTIVEAHGGAITACNREGAVIRFTLPVGAPPVVEEEAA